MWDARALLEGDPDQPGELYIRLLVNPAKPLPLAMVECTANLDITVSVTKLKTDVPGMVCFELGFFGKCLDLSELDMRLSEWQARNGIPNKSEEEFRRDRAALRSDW